jgi:transcriptional regulator GlxA family with amidase domain
VTSAGTAAGLDCCLHLVRAIRGGREANRVARAMVLAPHRDGGQSQFIEQPVAEDRRDTVLGALLADLRADLSQDMSIDSLAARVAMSRRTFTRRFDKATGMSVARWIDTERLRQAKDLLETSRMPIDRVAECAGFKSPVSFRQAFKRAMRVSPSEWRRTFGDEDTPAMR